MNFLDRLSKNTQIPNLMEICLVGADLFHVERRTDIIKLPASFHNFAGVPKKKKKRASEMFSSNGRTVGANAYVQTGSTSGVTRVGSIHMLCTTN